VTLRQGALLLQARIAEERARRSARAAGIALVYHRIDVRPGARALELAPAVGRAAFRAELEYLQRRYDVVAPSELHRAAGARRRGNRIPVGLTFDDDTRSHVDEALPALDASGVTAAFFVGGWSLHGDRRPWWERLQLAVDHGRLGPGDGLDEHDVAAALRREPGALKRLGGAVEALDPEQRRSLERRLAHTTIDLPKDTGLDRSDLAMLATRHEVGFHTRLHDRLSPLDDAELARALTDGRDVLAEAIGRAIDTIAYPHGDADGRVGAAARAAGYTLGFVGRNRALTADDDPLLLPRLDPSHESLGVFALTLARASLSA
jgi:peptidoglycan/xylan/chitin deacetylase (PgdA/CDA1 family)